MVMDNGDEGLVMKPASTQLAFYHQFTSPLSITSTHHQVLRPLPIDSELTTERGWSCHTMP